VYWTRHEPFRREANGIEQVGEDREQLRILVVIFLGILLIGVVVLRVRNCGQHNKKRGAENNCNSSHVINFARLPAIVSTRRDRLPPRPAADGFPRRIVLALAPPQAQF